MFSQYDLALHSHCLRQAIFKLKVTEKLSREPVSFGVSPRLHQCFLFEKHTKKIIFSAEAIPFYSLQINDIDGTITWTDEFMEFLCKFEYFDVENPIFTIKASIDEFLAQIAQNIINNFSIINILVMLPCEPLKIEYVIKAKVAENVSYFIGVRDAKFDGIMPEVEDMIIFPIQAQ